jgi:carbonic anhydrase
MSDHFPIGPQTGRRRFLAIAATGVSCGLIGATGDVAYADSITREQRDKMTPDEIIAMLKQGNERFRRGERANRNYLAEQKASAKGQYPVAVLLSCIDSRAPAEVIMDKGIGDIFNCRVAGNIANDDILGSIEYSCKVIGAKVVLVMGHTSCGAIKGAIDNVELGNLTGLLAKIRPAVKATKFEGERSSKNPAFVDAVARQNVELTTTAIREKSSVLRDLESKKAVKITGAMYNLETAKIEFFV